MFQKIKPSKEREERINELAKELLNEIHWAVIEMNGKPTIHPDFYYRLMYEVIQDVYLGFITAIREHQKEFSNIQKEGYFGG
jgi:hypothetical protein